MTAHPPATVLTSPAAPARILLWGPPTIDWLNVRHGQEGQLESGKQEVHLSAQPGGVAMLAKLLEEMSGSLKTDIEYCSRVKDLVQGLSNPSPLDQQYRHTWSLWKKGGKPKAYRMAGAGITNWEAEQEPPDDFLTALTPEPTGSLLILDDPGKTVVEKDVNWLDEELVKKHKIGHVLLRLDSRFAEQKQQLTDSKLYKRIAASEVVAERTTLVTTVRSLRASKVRVGGSLSWERMFDDVINAVHACFTMGAKFKRAIVTIGLSGAVLIDHSHQPPQFSLVFDRHGQERDFEAKHRGKVLGSSTCLLAALATAWEETRKGEMPWLYAVQRGVEMMRGLGEIGYLPSRQPKTRRVLEFPVKDIRRLYYDRGLEEPSDQLGRIVRGARAVPRWTILFETVPDEDEQLKVARQIVWEGESALQNVPIGKVGAWYSADRGEIEGVRSVHNAIRDYRNRKTESGPLSIAVFGPPGAGKSFVVREIAQELGIDKTAWLPFNLSQFESAAELAKAFHQIQDVLLHGADPLVFWDEFDSSCGEQPLGWLRHFLSPMQDGKFIDQGLVHPVGRGIYIFAGGTYPSFETFAADPTDAEKAAKKPDFVSRLRAYIDVKGPNRALPQDKGAPAEHDQFYMIRRAFLLLGSLHKHAKHLKSQDKKGYEVDDGVLNAFLEARRYKHGSRSLDSIVALSSFEGKVKYELSSLPPEHLLGMHIDDVADFMRHVNQRP